MHVSRVEAGSAASREYAAHVCAVPPQRRLLQLQHNYSALVVHGHVLFCHGRDYRPRVPVKEVFVRFLANHAQVVGETHLEKWRTDHLQRDVQCICVCVHCLKRAVCRQPQDLWRVFGGTGERFGTYETRLGRTGCRTFHRALAMLHSIFFWYASQRCVDAFVARTLYLMRLKRHRSQQWIMRFFVLKLVL